MGPYLFTLADDDQCENAEVAVYDATADRFPFTFTGTAGSVARMSLGKQQTDTACKEEFCFNQQFQF